MTAGFVQIAVKLSLSVMHDMAGGILSHDFEFSRQQTLSRPVCMGVQFPQMHLFRVTNIEYIVIQYARNMDLFIFAV